MGRRVAKEDCGVDAAVCGGCNDKATATRAGRRSVHRTCARDAHDFAAIGTRSGLRNAHCRSAGDSAARGKRDHSFLLHGVSRCIRGKHAKNGGERLANFISVNFYNAVFATNFFAAMGCCDKF